MSRKIAVMTPLNVGKFKDALDNYNFIIDKERVKESRIFFTTEE